MHESTSWLLMISRFCDFVMFMHLLYYFWGALGGLLGLRCVRNGASESLVNMQGSASANPVAVAVQLFIFLFAGFAECLS